MDFTVTVFVCFHFAESKESSDDNKRLGGTGKIKSIYSILKLIYFMIFCSRINQLLQIELRDQEIKLYLFLTEMVRLQITMGSAGVRWCRNVIRAF
jgi:hypothetical protein